MPFKFNFSNKTEIVEFKSINRFSTQGAWMPDFIVYENYFYFNNNQIKDEFHLPLDYIKSWASNHFEDTQYNELTEITQELFHKAEPVFRELISELFLEVKNLPAKIVYSSSDFNKKLGQLAKYDFAQLNEDDAQEDDVQQDCNTNIVDDKQIGRYLKHSNSSTDVPIGIKFTLINPLFLDSISFDVFNMRHELGCYKTKCLLLTPDLTTIQHESSKDISACQTNEYIFDFQQFNNEYKHNNTKKPIRISKEILDRDKYAGKFVFKKIFAYASKFTAFDFNTAKTDNHLKLNFHMLGLAIDRWEKHHNLDTEKEHSLEIDMTNKFTNLIVTVPPKCKLDLFLFF